MTGWNLPPGCEVHHIPGNRPEDEAAEAWVELLYEKAAELGALPTPDDPLPEPVVLLLTWARDTGWQDGFAAGQDEAAFTAYAEAEARQEAATDTDAQVRLRERVRHLFRHHHG